MQQFIEGIFAVGMCALTLFSNLSLAGGPDLEWAAIENGTGSGVDTAYAITTDSAGNTYVTGESPGAGSMNDILTVKYNPSGVKQWSHRFNGAGNRIDSASVIRLGPNGSVYVAGVSHRLSSNSDFILLKYNADGTLAWTKSYDSPGTEDEVLEGMEIDLSGNVIIGGTTWGAGGQNTTMCNYGILKYSGTTGDPLWAQAVTYDRVISGHHGFDEARALTLDSSGNIYITGHSTVPGYSNGFDLVTIKYSPDGVELWKQIYDGPEEFNDDASAIAVDQNGNTFVAGFSSSTNGGLDYTVLKYSPSGSLEWVNSYSGANEDVARAMGIDPDGNVIVSGVSGTQNPFPDIVTLKYDTNGNELWRNRYDSPLHFDDEAVSMKIDALGNTYIAGSSFDVLNWRSNYLTMRLSPSGSIDWTELYSDSSTYSQSFGYAIALSDDGLSAFVTGTSGDGYYATIKYSVLTGVQTPLSLAPKKFSLASNYPNPFNPSTTIHYSLPTRERVRLTVFDSLSHEVAVLVNEDQFAGEHTATFQASGLPSGVYFYRLEAGSFTDTKKMILLK